MVYAYITGKTVHEYETLKECLKNAIPIVKREAIKNQKEDMKRLKTWSSGYAELTIFRYPKGKKILDVKTNSLTDFGFYHAIYGLLWMGAYKYPQFESGRNQGEKARNVKMDGSLGGIGWRHP